MTEQKQIILITQGDIGGAMIAATTQMFGKLPLHATVISVSRDCNLEVIFANLEKTVSEQTGTQFIVLTDLFGSTPCNLAKKLEDNNLSNVHVITGLNQPMLIRIMNYANLPLDELINKAISGGKEGIRTL